MKLILFVLFVSITSDVISEGDSETTETKNDDVESTTVPSTFFAFSESTLVSELQTTLVSESEPTTVLSTIVETTTTISETTVIVSSSTEEPAVSQEIIETSGWKDIELEEFLYNLTSLNNQSLVIRNSDLRSLIFPDFIECNNCTIEISNNNRLTTVSFPKFYEILKNSTTKEHLKNNNGLIIFKFFNNLWFGNQAIFTELREISNPDVSRIESHPCMNLTAELLRNESFVSNCTALGSFSHRKLLTKKWSNLTFETFIHKLEILVNIEMRIINRFEETIEFAKFEECNDCSISINSNIFLKLVSFPNYKNPDPFRLEVRGNRYLFQENLNFLKNLAVDEENIQKAAECSFSHPIARSTDYSKCDSVWGDMKFNGSFLEAEPAEMRFNLHGCFHLIETGIRFLRPFFYVNAHCAKKHVFDDNRFACTDQLRELETILKNVTITGRNGKTNVEPVNCYQGECFVGHIQSDLTASLKGCEYFKGYTQISESSGNLTSTIHDISFARSIDGSLVVENNPSIETLSMPRLKKITSSKCPALRISNMTNLKYVIFHPLIAAECSSGGPAVVVENNPKLKLHNRMRKRLFMGLYEFDLAYKTWFDTETAFFISILCCVLLLIIIETVVWLRSKNVFKSTSFYETATTSPSPPRVPPAPSVTLAQNKKTD